MPMAQLAQAACQQLGLTCPPEALASLASASSMGTSAAAPQQPEGAWPPALHGSAAAGAGTAEAEAAEAEAEAASAAGAFVQACMRPRHGGEAGEAPSLGPLFSQDGRLTRGMPAHARRLGYQVGWLLTQLAQLQGLKHALVAAQARAARSVVCCGVVGAAAAAAAAGAGAGPVKRAGSSSGMGFAQIPLWVPPIRPMRAVSQGKAVSEAKAAKASSQPQGQFQEDKAKQQQQQQLQAGTGNVPAICLAPDLMGPEGVLVSRCLRSCLPSPAVTSFTDLARLTFGSAGNTSAAQTASLQARLDQESIEAAQQAAAMIASKAEASPVATQQQLAMQAMYRAAMQARERLGLAWQGQYVLFDGGAASVANAELLQAAGLGAAKALAGSKGHGGNGRGGDGGDASHGDHDSESVESDSDDSELESELEPEPGQVPGQQPGAGGPTQGGLRCGRLLALLHHEDVSTPGAQAHLHWRPPRSTALLAACWHASTDGSHAIAGAEVVAMDCGAAWLHGDASGPGSLAHALFTERCFHELYPVQVGVRGGSDNGHVAPCAFGMHAPCSCSSICALQSYGASVACSCGLFATAHSSYKHSACNPCWCVIVQVHLGGPRTCLVPASPQEVVVSLRLLYLPLALLAHCSGDPHLRSALYEADPWQAIAAHWESTAAAAAVSSPASKDAPPDGAEQGKGATGVGCRPGPDSSSSEDSGGGAPAGAANTATGGASGSAAAAAGAAKLQKLLHALGPVAETRGLAWAAQQLVASMALGEAPKQLALRLQGQSTALFRGQQVSGWTCGCCVIHHMPYGIAI